MQAGALPPSKLVDRAKQPEKDRIKSTSRVRFAGVRHISPSAPKASKQEQKRQEAETKQRVESLGAPGALKGGRSARKLRESESKQQIEEGPQRELPRVDKECKGIESGSRLTIEGLDTGAQQKDILDIGEHPRDKVEEKHEREADTESKIEAEETPQPLINLACRTEGVEGSGEQSLATRAAVKDDQSKDYNESSPRPAEPTKCLEDNDEARVDVQIRVKTEFMARRPSCDVKAEGLAIVVEPQADSSQRGILPHRPEGACSPAVAKSKLEDTGDLLSVLGAKLAELAEATQHSPLDIDTGDAAWRALHLALDSPLMTAAEIEYSPLSLPTPSAVDMACRGVSDDLGAGEHSDSASVTPEAAGRAGSQDAVFTEFHEQCDPSAASEATFAVCHSGADIWTAQQDGALNTTASFVRAGIAFWQQQASDPEREVSRSPDGSRSPCRKKPNTEAQTVSPEATAQFPTEPQVADSPPRMVVALPQEAQDPARHVTEAALEEARDRAERAKERNFERPEERVLESPSKDDEEEAVFTASVQSERMVQVSAQAGDAADGEAQERGHHAGLQDVMESRCGKEADPQQWPYLTGSGAVSDPQLFDVEADIVLPSADVCFPFAAQVSQAPPASPAPLPSPPLAPAQQASRRPAREEKQAGREGRGHVAKPLPLLLGGSPVAKFDRKSKEVAPSPVLRTSRRLDYRDGRAEPPTAHREAQPPWRLAVSIGIGTALALAVAIDLAWRLGPPPEHFA